MTHAKSGQAEQYDTIIIGAGMSGLACAGRLLEHHSYQAKPSGSTEQPKKLLVLEARDRIGGRIGSVRVNGNRLDTGANWIHGVGSPDSPAGENPLVKILPKKEFRELGCSVSFRAPSGSKESNGENAAKKTIVETPFEYDWVRLDTLSNRGNETNEQTDLVIPPKISGMLFQSLWTLIGSIHQRSQEVSKEDAKKISILKAIMEDKRFSDAFENIPQKYHASLAGLPQFIENMEAGPLDAGVSPTGATPLAGLGLLEYAIDDFDGEQVFLRDGYTSVVEEVGKKVIEQGHVKLGAEVTQISWGSGKSIKVSSKAGIFLGKRVICTLPLGVLKHHISHSSQNSGAGFFSPRLPSETRKAIQSLGFGTLDKVFLVYSKPWWKEEPWYSIVRKGFTFQHIPGDDGTDANQDTVDEPDSFWGFTTELPGISISPGHDGPIPGARALSLINLHALTGYPVLSCFVSCANALHIEGLSDDAAGDLVRRSLAQWLGQEPPAPDAVHVTRWAQDEFARGSYSHMIAGLSDKEHREECGCTINNDEGAELRFAGEHTSINHFATVHGALLSGWREADSILEADDRLETYLASRSLRT